MRRGRVALGGAVAGGLLGILFGALAGMVYGAFRGDVSLGLDGALLGGSLLAVAGAIYGAVTGPPDETRLTHEFTPPARAGKGAAKTFSASGTRSP